MKPIVLTREQRQEIEQRRKATLDRRIYQRLTAVLAVALGYTRADAADLVGIGLTQLGEWLRVFRRHGLEMPAVEVHPVDARTVSVLPSDDEEMPAVGERPPPAEEPEGLCFDRPWLSRPHGIRVEEGPVRVEREDRPAVRGEERRRSDAEAGDGSRCSVSLSGMTICTCADSTPSMSVMVCDSSSPSA